MQAILGLIGCFPQFVKLASELWSYLNKVSGNDPATYVSKVGEALAKLNHAETQDDHRQAAKAIAEAIAGLKF